MQPGKPYGLIEDGAVAISGERIAWVGPMSELSAPPSELARSVRDCQGDLVTPGLVECHTHLVYGGERSGEFEQRLNGVSYEEISRSGGGINATVTATRAASDVELFDAAVPRLQRLMLDGVTTVEIKSGYGLTTNDELKQLRAARALGDNFAVDVHTTFLGAHAVPPEFAGRPDDYITKVVEEMLPAVVAERAADAVDAFCENIAFSVPQCRKVFTAAQDAGLPIKLHAEQLSNSGGAAMAASMGALSVDHIEYLSDADVVTLKENGTVAVLLPGAFFVLKESQKPPVDALRAANVPIALSTDCNPGSSPVLSLLLMMNMGCTLFGLTPEEALAGVTRSAAAALGVGDEVGTIEAGKRADLVQWRAHNPAQLSYLIGDLPCEHVLYRGRDR